MSRDRRRGRRRVALHLIMPNQVSGPNSGKRLIHSSWLAEHYDFAFFSQNWHAGGKLNIALVRDLARQLKEINPDVVHVSGLQGAALHAVLAARIATRAKVLLSINGFAGDAVSLSPLGRAIFNLIVEPLTLLLTSRFYVVCHEASQRTIVRVFRSRFAGVIHNAAPIIDFDISEVRAEMRERLRYRSDEFVAIVVGRMLHDKGIEYIAEAARDADLKRVRWLLVGDGPLYEDFSRRWPDLVESGQVTLVGKVNNVKQYLAAADLFVFGTLHENLSNALLEAMAVGLPVVATAVGGNVEVVEHGRNGVLVDAGNSVAIADGVKRVLALSQEDRERWGEESRRIAGTKFSQDHLFDHIRDLYEGVA